MPVNRFGITCVPAGMVVAVGVVAVGVGTGAVGVLGTTGAATTGSPSRPSAHSPPSIAATGSSRSSLAGTTQAEMNSPFFGTGRPSAVATSGSLS